MPDFIKYHQLQKNEQLPGNESRQQDETLSSWIRYQLSWGVCCLLGLSIMANVILGTLYSKSRNETRTSQWAHLATNITIPMYKPTEYGPDISSDAEIDRLWNAIEPGLGVIALPNDWADQHGLPRSARFPWDDSSGIYEIAAFHGLHCLIKIRDYVSANHQGRTSSVSYHHIGHCLDMLFQDLKCQADDMPWYKEPPEGYRQGFVKTQTRLCKDWEKLLDWTREKSACFRFENVTDRFGNPTDDPFEAYKYCPEGSPYIPEMEKYFERKYASRNNE